MTAQDTHLHLIWEWLSVAGVDLYEPWSKDAPGAERAFIDWVTDNLGQQPAGHGLDRLDKTVGFEPGNLGWLKPYGNTH